MISKITDLCGSKAPAFAPTFFLPSCSNIAVMYDAKLISHIVTLSVVLFASIVPVPALLVRHGGVGLHFWSTWSVRTAIVKAICDVIIFTIAVILFINRRKVSGQLIDTLRCLAFAIVITAEVCNINHF